jgi:hypothetical protein
MTNDDNATGLYLHLCRLPKEEKEKFLNWARDYIKNLDKKLKKEKESVSTDRTDIR